MPPTHRCLNDDAPIVAQCKSGILMYAATCSLSIDSEKCVKYLRLLRWCSNILTQQSFGLLSHFTEEVCEMRIEMI